MLCYPNAKINIGLKVLEKRSDGYHNLETIFYPIPLYDALELVPDNSGKEPYTWGNSGIEVDTASENNICIKALKLVKARYELPAVNVHLHKMIPFGAGLGGGSADGAFMLTLLNKEFKLNMSAEELYDMARQLGADCPFFLSNRPACASGIGDIIQAIEPDLSGYHLYLIKPPLHVSTPEAYNGVRPHATADSLKDLIQLPVEQWKYHIKNDFEKSVFAKYPEIGRLKMMLYDAGALYASMSGSGSAVFGIFSHKPSINAEGSNFTWESQL